MLKRRVLGALRLVFDICRRVLHVLGRCIRWVFERYRDAHRQNLLLRALRGRKVSEPEPQHRLAPQPKPKHQPSGKILPFRRRPDPSAKPSAAVERTSTPKRNSAFAAVGDVSLGLVASAVPTVLVCLLMLESSSSTSNRVITTEANETTAAELPGGGTVALGARSTLNVGLRPAVGCEPDGRRGDI